MFIFKKKFVPGSIWFLIMCVLLFMPGTDVPKADNWMEKIFFDKWVHSGIFGLLTLLWMWPVAKSNLPDKQKKINFLIIAFLFIAWGLSTEFIQKYYCTSRGFDLWDWAADTFGITVAYIIIRFKIYPKNKSVVTP